jgi:hypothetical protein
MRRLVLDWVLFEYSVKDALLSPGMQKIYPAIFSFLINLVWIGVASLLVMLRSDRLAVAESLSTVDIILNAILLAFFLHGVLAISDAIIFQKYPPKSRQDLINQELSRLILVGIATLRLNHQFFFWIMLVTGIYILLFFVLSKLPPILNRTRILSEIKSNSSIWKNSLRVMLAFQLCSFLLWLPVLFFGARLVINQELTTGQMLLVWTMSIPMLASQFRLVRAHLGNQS